MRIIAKRTLREFWQSHPDAEGPLQAWYGDVKDANWDTLYQLKAIYPGASIIAGSRTVFNIKGNHYRQAVRIDYRRRFVYPPQWRPPR